MATSAPHLRSDPAFWIVLATALVILATFALGIGLGFGLFRPRIAATDGWTLRGVVGVIFAAIALVFAAKAVSMTPAKPRTAPGLPSTPQAILDARYAKGEIARDDYLRMRSDLEGPKR